MKLTWVVLGFSLLAPGGAAAQGVMGQGPGIDRGTRIRIVEGSERTRREGVLVEWRNDSALARIDASGAYVIIPPDLLSNLEVYDGQRSGAGTGAKVGAGIGLGLSLVLVLAASTDEWTAPSAGEAVAFTALNTGIYAGLGALIGSFVKKPRWRRHSLAPRLQAAMDLRGRPGIAVTFGF